MFVYYFISVLKCQVLMFGFHPSLIDVASVMFSEECCYFILLSLEHIQTVLCLQGSGLIPAAAQLDSWCYSHVYLFVTDFYWVAPPRYFPSFSWFPMFCFFSTRKDSVNVLCWEKVAPEPFDHVVLSCCLLGKKKKVLFVDRSGVVTSVLKLLL